MAEGKIGIGGSFYGFLFRGSIIFCVLMAGLFSFDNSEAGYYSWTNEGGPYGGRIQTAAFLNNSTILAGSRHGGIYVSHDTGNSWTVVNQGLTNYIINDLAGNPANSNTVYAATGGGGVFRTYSATGDCSWVSRSYNLGSDNVLSLAVCPADTTTLVAGTVNGIYKTVNCASYWYEISGDLPDKNINAVAFASGGADTIFVGTNSGVFKTENNGSTWLEKNTGLTNPFITDIKINRPISPLFP